MIWRPTKCSSNKTPTPQKRCLFHHRGLKWKIKKSRGTWSNRQIWPCNTKWSRTKANRVLPRECTRRLHPWTSSDGQYWNHIDYIHCSWRWRSFIQSAKARLGADCDSDHELLIEKLRLKLKKVGKTIRPFRYDLNQIPYDYTVKLTNRFKGLHLIDRVHHELWTEVSDIVQETGIRTIPKEKKNATKQNGCLRRPYK